MMITITFFVPETMGTVSVAEGLCTGEKMSSTTSSGK